MPRSRKPITKEQILEYVPQLERREMTRKQVAAALGITTHTLRARVKEFGIDLPVVRHPQPLAERLLGLYTIDELHQKTGHQIARELNITQPGVCAALKQLGIKSDWAHQSRQELETKCQLVVDHIEENGGYVTHAIKALGVKVCKGAVYHYAEDIGFDLEAYRFAHRNYGYWTTLPGIAEKFCVSDYKLQARCNLCGTVHTVSLVNLKSGASTMCRSCASDFLGQHRKVRCVETGEVFKSVRAWTKKIGMFKQYQQLRIKLNRDGYYEHGDLTYEFKPASTA